MSVACRIARGLQSDHTPSSSSSSSFWAGPSLALPRSRSKKTTGPLMSYRGSNYKPVAAATTVTTPQEQVKKPAGSNELSAAAMRLLDLHLQSHPSFAARPTRPIAWTLRAEMTLERGVVGCRSFALIAVAGSLMGSILCFLEGCFFVMESFLEFFLSVSQRLDRGGIIQLLIQAIDMFLVGTALLTFGMGIYVMFIETNETRRRRPLMAEANFFGQFNLKRLSECMQMRSISQAKSRIGHAVALILQAGMVDKFRTVPVTSGLDLACFAGALLSASATVFLLSKLTANHTSPCIKT